MPRRKTVIMGAAGRDFHNFNTVYRTNPDVEVVAFTATQIPDLAGRRYPPELAGELYALLVDQVSEVMTLQTNSFEQNPPTLPPQWSEFSAGIYRLQGRLLVVLDVGRLLSIGPLLRGRA